MNQLREALASRGLSIEGRKPDLVSRLQAALEADEDAADVNAIAINTDQFQLHPDAAPPQHHAPMELASEEVVAKVVALQETVESAVGEALDLIQNEAYHNHTSGVDHDVLHSMDQGGEHEHLGCEQRVSIQLGLVNNPLAKKPSAGPSASKILSHTISASWESQFIKLQAYKAQHGDCKVPKKYPPDLQLGRWVSVYKLITINRMGQTVLNYSITIPKRYTGQYTTIQKQHQRTQPRQKVTPQLHQL